MVQSAHAVDADRRGPYCRSGGEEIDSSPSGVTHWQFKDFYVREFPALVRFARTQTSSGANAEDIASEAMMVVLTKWPDLAARQGDVTAYQRLRSYTFGVVRNLSHECRRKESRMQSLGEAPAEHSYAVDPVNSRVAFLDILDLLAGLPSRQREVLALQMVGFSMPEIAEALDLQASTARTHLASARRHLREALEIMSAPRPSYD